MSFGTSNHLLRLCDESTFLSLQEHSKELTFARGDVLHRTSETIDFVFFPVSCIVSVLVRSDAGVTAETAIIGPEGMIGSSVIQGIMTSFVDATVQVEGRMIKVPAAKFYAAGLVSESLRKTISLFDLSLLAQSQQSTLCQATHQVEARAARWLLQCRKRLRTDDIPMTQEFFAQMLGVQRTTITLAEKNLQQAGLIELGRGRVRIIDAKGLEEASCECFARIEQRYEELLGKPN